MRDFLVPIPLARYPVRMIGQLATTSLALGLTTGLLGCVKPPPCPVFAAASIAPLVAQIGRDAGLTISLHPAASSTLAQQIRQGAQAQVFVSAHSKWMDELERMGLLIKGSRRPFVQSGLILVAPKSQVQSTSADAFELTPTTELSTRFEGRLAVGDPAHVPVGRYAKAALQRLGLWEQVANRLAPAIDARATLNLVERGECSLGIVYQTDAAASDRVTVVAHFPPSAQPDVIYEVALVADEITAIGRALYDALLSPKGRARLTAAGFEVVD